MPKITKRLVDATAPAAKDCFVWDSEAKGFGLKVTPAGRRVYIIQFRTGGRGTPTKRFTIGQHGAPWTPEAARSEAKRLMGLVASGKDPAAERRKGRAQQAEAAANTFADLVPQFIERHYRANRLRSTDEVEGILNREFVNRWRRRPVADISRKDIARAIDEIADRAPILANRAFGHLSQFLSWCVARHVIDANPMAGFKKPSKERSRDRVLSDDEIRDVWNACNVVGWPFGPAVRLMLLTGQRRDEVAGMRRSEIEIDKRLWSLPAERTKNQRQHDVPLSDLVLSILADMPNDPDADLIFTTTGSTAISGFSRAKRRLDEAIARDRQEKYGEGAEPMPDWRLHDLRRTMTTGMAQLGTPPHVADRVLNHASGTIGTVAAIYNRHQYLPERRIALDAWSRRVEEIVHGRPEGTVLPMVRGQ